MVIYTDSGNRETQSRKFSWKEKNWIKTIRLREDERFIETRASTKDDRSKNRSVKTKKKSTKINIYVYEKEKMRTAFYDVVIIVRRAFNFRDEIKEKRNEAKIERNKYLIEKKNRYIYIKILYIYIYLI